MGQSYDLYEKHSWDKATTYNKYTHLAQVYFDYYGCLPDYEDEAHHKKFMKATILA